MIFRVLAAVLCSASLLPFSTYAAVDLDEELRSLAPSKLLLNAEGQHDHWNGIGRIKSRKGSHCTATLIDTRSPDSPPQAPAYVLTNGHCISRKNGVIITDGAIHGSVQFNFFVDSVAQSYPLKRVRWSSMQGVDIAIVELQPTLETLIDDGIKPLRISSRLPEEGHEILWIGAPLYMNTGHLRMSACVNQLSGVVLKQPWVWRHTVRNQCKDVDIGASGSPLLTRDNHEIFAVANFITQPSGENGEKPPPGFPPLAPGSNFGSPVSQLNDCFIDGVFNSDPKHCSLFPTLSVKFKAPRKHHSKIQLDAEGREVYPEWNLHFTVDKPFYRYKKADDPMQCENPVGYGNAITSQDAAITDSVGTRIGINWLCMIGVLSADERPSLGMMRNALTLAMELQAAGPTIAPKVQIEKNRFGVYRVRWLLEKDLIDYYTAKIGPEATTDCSTAEGFRRRLGDLHLRLKSLPTKICTYAHDVNGQPSSVREDIVTAPDKG